MFDQLSLYLIYIQLEVHHLCDNLQYWEHYNSTDYREFALSTVSARTAWVQPAREGGGGRWINKILIFPLSPSAVTTADIKTSHIFSLGW